MSSSRALAGSALVALVLGGCADAAPRRHTSERYAVDPAARVQARIASIEVVDDYSQPPPSPRLATLRQRIDEIDALTQAVGQIADAERRR